MPQSVEEVRVAGSSIVVSTRPILEPLNAPSKFIEQLKRFENGYNTSTDSHLYRFLSALCGEAGAGSIKKEQTFARLQQKLEATHYSDLDRLYGAMLGLARLPEEQYIFDPKNEVITEVQRIESLTKDSQYRSRCLLWAWAISEGASLTGIKLAAEAALGIECDVFEQYRWIDDQASDIPVMGASIGQTNSRNEFVIIPRINDVTDRERRQIIRLIDKLRPTNSIPTVYSGDHTRLERSILDVVATSERFNVARFVTGRPDIDWPAIDLTQGYWIDKSEKEAPKFSWIDRQEAVTFMSVVSTTSSSEHIGQFNQAQKALFSHLSNIYDDYLFADDFSNAQSIAPYTISIPWTSRGVAPRDIIMVNGSYPLGYFAERNITPTTDAAPELFWSSVEKLAPATDYLLYDLGRLRPINFIDFQVCQKPVDFTIEWSTDAVTWQPIQLKPEYDTAMAVDYLPSDQNPWAYFEAHFTTIDARYIRVTFTRRDTRFPLPISDAFYWSIEARNLRIMHVIATEDDFIADAGVDILGNAYRTELDVYVAENVIDYEEEDTVWLSQPNPSRMAVEALYFDMRNGWREGTMSYLDQWEMSDLDDRSMSDMALHYEDGVVIDEVYINPVTVGPDMHIYYSLDDTPDWDNKLWVPVPRTYTLRRGFHALPSPTFVKYLKLEFTNLAAVPYQPIEYPRIPQITFRRHPSWVQDYFATLYPFTDTATQVAERVEIDPLALGFTRPDTNLQTALEDQRKIVSEEDTNEELRLFIQSLSTNQEEKAATEATIRVYTPIIWQEDLIQQLDTSRALSRIAVEDRDGLTDTGFTAELGLPILSEPVQQSVSDLEDAHKEKKQASPWFPRTCRHAYQIIRATFSNKVAYQVGIKEVKFYRRDYLSEFDEPYYLESLGDINHIERNDFTNNDWNYNVLP